MICEYFGVSTDYLLNVKNTSAKTQAEDEVLYAFRSLNNEQQTIVLEQTKAVAKLNYKTDESASNSQNNFLS